MSNNTSKVSKVQVGDRVRRASRYDGSGQGVVVAIESRRAGMPAVTVRYDTSENETTRSLAYWVKL